MKKIILLILISFNNLISFSVDVTWSDYGTDQVGQFGGLIVFVDVIGRDDDFTYLVKTRGYKSSIEVYDNRNLHLYKSILCEPNNKGKKKFKTLKVFLKNNKLYILYGLKNKKDDTFEYFFQKYNPDDFSSSNGPLFSLDKKVYKSKYLHDSQESYSKFYIGTNLNTIASGTLNIYGDYYLIESLRLTAGVGFMSFNKYREYSFYRPFDKNEIEAVHENLSGGSFYNIAMAWLTQTKNGIDFNYYYYLNFRRKQFSINQDDKLNINLSKISLGAGYLIGLKSRFNLDIQA